MTMCTIKTKQPSSKFAYISPVVYYLHVSQIRCRMYSLSLVWM